MQETNRIFDTADDRLREEDCGLRIRETRPLDGNPSRQPTLTFKGPRTAGTFKSRLELETTVDDATTLTDILFRLGFRELVVYEKRRETWRLENCTICLDELPRLGWYAEIEGPSAAALENAWQRLELAAPPMGETYVELAAAHGVPDQTGCRRLLFSR